MKNTMKKLTAGVSALAMAATLSATSVPAFAAEFENMEAQEFVNSFEDERAHNVAQYCVDNCATLDEAREIMKTYMEGRALIDSESTITSLAKSTKKTHQIGGAYYSASSVAKTEHKAALLVMNSSAAMRGAIDVMWNHSLIEIETDRINEEGFIKFINGQSMASNAYGNSSTGENYLNFYGSIVNTTTGEFEGHSAVLCTIPIEPKSNATSEAAIHSSFTRDIRGLFSTNGYDTDIEIHTYALGDYDHNGIVNSADASYLLELLTGYDVEFTYNSGNDPYNTVAGPINVLAADADESGSINIADVTWINNHIS